MVAVCNRSCIRMREMVVPMVAVLRSVCFGKRFLKLSTSRAFSNQIIESPSLLSLDIADSWSPASKHSDQPCTQERPKNWTAKIIDGKAIAEGIRSKIASEISRMKELIGQAPGLAVILVGQRRDSQTYVRNKIIASEEVGIKIKITCLPENCTECEVCNPLCGYNEDPSIHGILVQLPLPQHLDEAKILNLISLEKDVDGFHPLNIGNLAMQGMEPLFIPCTPKGCIELLLRSGVEIMGKKAVVIGRSNIVGLPTSLLLQDPRSEYGYRLIGDVCFNEATRIASAITPVPGGVGPMTVAMLLYNTLESAKRAFNFT